MLILRPPNVCRMKATKSYTVTLNNCLTQWPSYFYINLISFRYYEKGQL